MKHLQVYFPLTLLLAYCVFTAFVPATIAHSIIILSLATLSGYSIHISRQENLKYNKEVLDSLKNELEAKLMEQKGFHDKKLSKLEDELAKVQLNTIPRASSSSSPQPRKVVF
jgi:hypothetical protein